jgi:crotonobetainyl-CoA:carnitine CoA-transferase CaiB-like acyl-CoA transferase
LEDDPRFAGFDERSEHREELLAILRPALRALPTEEAIARLSGAGVPCGAVNDVLGVLDDPQVAAREDVVGYEHPVLGPVRQFAAPYRMGTTYSPAPAQGEGTEALLRALCGYDEARLSAAREGGAFG